MTRARLWAAHLLVKAASLLTREASPEPAEADDDELPMPAGYPRVQWSERAQAMLRDGARRAPPEKKPEPEAPLAGSLRDRMNRSDL